MPRIGIPIIRITSLDLDVYSGDEITATSYLASVLLSILETLISYLRKEKALDHARLRVIPCYINEQTTVKISIRLFTSIALFISGLIHTKNGYAKRSIRKDIGQNAG